jgi:hypothetical protein
MANLGPPHPAFLGILVPQRGVLIIGLTPPSQQESSTTLRCARQNCAAKAVVDNAAGAVYDFGRFGS